MKFYLKKSDSESNLIMGVLYDSQFHDGRFVYSTGERIKPQNWSQPKVGTGKPRKGHEDLTERLLEISKQATSFIRLNRSNLAKEGLKSHLDNLRPKEQRPLEQAINDPKALTELWRRYLVSLKDTVEKATYNSYHNSFQATKKREKRIGFNFSEFVKSKGWDGITPSQFTFTHYQLYLGYLKTNCKPNTVAKRLKHLKAFLEHVQNDLNMPVGMDPKKIKYREGPGLKISLTEDQLQKYISDDKIPRHLLKVRDLAVVQASTGLRISDRARIDKNIKGGKISLHTKKTKTAVEILISPHVRAILEKYDYELPNVSEQHFRSGLKKLHKFLFPNDMIQIREGQEFKEVFVGDEISSHDLVRTFITLSHERGMSIASIAKITGKSAVTLIKNYLVESQKVADKEMEKAWGSSPLKLVR